VKCGKPREKIYDIKRGKQSKDISLKTKYKNFKEEKLVRMGFSSDRKYIQPIVREIGLNDCGCNVEFKRGIVLDPFFGAGTTGLVALKQDKKFIGIELNPEYIEIANKRLKPYLEQRKLFANPKSSEGEKDV